VLVRFPPNRYTITGMSVPTLSSDLSLKRMGEELERKERGSRAHAERVASFATLLAKLMGLDRGTTRTIRQGALLHEIGKLAIPDAILHKSAKLSAEESAVLRGYCYEGYEILKQLPAFAGCAEIVYSHKEFYNGTGYPRRLKGEAIPFGARIVSVADALDTMQAERGPHRWPRTLHVARGEIRRWSGIYFDPDVVAALSAGPDHVWERCILL
jgi:HD-GYP domain-containing protein (c-di-GMP phosphodiesterase class II)